jgi:hypothetical protein
VATARQQHTVDPLLAQQASVDHQLIRAIVGVADQHGVAMLGSDILNAARQTRIVGVRDIRDHQRQRPSLPASQPAGE